MAGTAKTEGFLRGPPERASSDGMTVTVYFDRGLRRSGGPWLSVSGRLCSNDDGLRSQFSLELSGNVVRDVAFKASTCITLVAYCELLAARVTGMPLREAARVSPSQLVAALPGVPVAKQRTASLPVQALHSAILGLRDVSAPSSTKWSE